MIIYLYFYTRGEGVLFRYVSILDFEVYVHKRDFAANAASLQDIICCELSSLRIWAYGDPTSKGPKPMLRTMKGGRDVRLIVDSRGWNERLRSRRGKEGFCFGALGRIGP